MSWDVRGFLGLAGLLLGIPCQPLRAALSALGKPRPSLLLYLDLPILDKTGTLRGIIEYILTFIIIFLVG